MPEMAVAQGAAYYGLVRRGLATRIKGGTPRAFYVGVDASGSRRRVPTTEAGRPTEPARFAVCLAPPGLEDGARVQLERDFKLVTNRPGQLPAVLVEHARRSARRARPDRRRQGRHASTTAATCSSCRRSSPCCARAAAARSPCASRSTSPSSARSRSTASIAEPPNETWKLAFDMRSGGAAPARRGRRRRRAAPATDVAKARVTKAFKTGDGLATLDARSRDPARDPPRRLVDDDRARAVRRAASRSPPSARRPPITSSAGSTSPASCSAPAPARRSTPGARA